MKTLEKCTLIDIGTGSGCIPISIIKILSRGDISTFATDISKPALAVAKKNAQTHQVPIQFLHGNLLEPILLKNIASQLPVIITANLPYLTQTQFDEESSIQHEPKSALVADDQGLALYKKLLKQVQTNFANQISLTLFFEIDPSQATPLEKYIHSLFPKAETKVISDYRNEARVIEIQI